MRLKSAAAAGCRPKCPECPAEPACSYSRKCRGRAAAENCRSQSRAGCCRIGPCRGTKNAEDANEAATDTAQSYEDARNSAAHTYSQSAEDVAKTNEANQAQATVTQAQLDIARAELSALQSLKAADCVLSAPEDGTLTQLNLEAGQTVRPWQGFLRIGTLPVY